MFLIKRFKRNCPEEIHIEKSEVRIEKSTNLNLRDFDYITNAIVKALTYRTNPLKSVVDLIKGDKETFKEFIKFIKRNYSERELLTILEKYKKST